MTNKSLLMTAAMLLAGCTAIPESAEPIYDLVIYGSSPAALTAAIEAQSLGRTAVIVSPETRIGGLTTGGLGQTDIGNRSAFGGLSLAFYREVAAYYRESGHWKYERREDYLPDGQCEGSQDAGQMWTFEPSAALQILEGWERRFRLDIRRGERLDRGRGGVTLEKGRIIAIRTLSGRSYRGRMFVDATYEGDLMAAAGVKYVVGREANSVYGETINGYAPAVRGAQNHQLRPGIDPYVVKGDSKSAFIRGVEPYDPAAKAGDGDRRVQAYCFRMCLTDVPENRIPFAKPAGYDERDYELLFRNYEQGAWAEGCPWINSRMPNRKTDTNNCGGFSTDFIGGNWDWAEASYEERERILKAHLDYQRGLMWTLANHPRVPEKVRQVASRWGTCKDEFADGLGDGWQRQLYVREARRLVGDFVMTEHHCRGAKQAPRPVAMAAYGMDSHHCRRMVTAKGEVRNEGNVQDFVGIDGKDFPPYGIDYGAIVPQRSDCVNLFVPVCLSASHVAFGSIRMEPVFFALGQVAGAAAALAIDADVPVQEVDYPLLRARLVAAGAVK